MPTPSLYFWSRPDWTAKHMAIAQQQGHLCKGAEVSDAAAASPCQRNSNMVGCYPKSSNANNFAADLYDDRMKTSTLRQSTVSTTADLCDDRIETSAPRESTDICEDKMKSSTLMQSRESKHTADLCDDRMQISISRLSTESKHTADLCDDRMKTSELRHPTQSNQTADLCDESNHIKGNIRLDSLGFAPGPYRPLQENSAGWLDE